jgi:SAM-dependent methyltransferase
MSPDVALPATTLPGAIPTLNGTGFMHEALDDYAKDFIAFAATAPGEVLDIGCAYGVATLAALAAGARVCACDMEPKHLDLVRERTPLEQRARLRTVAGAMPDVQFPPNSFDAILASRVLHFLAGPDVSRTIAAMHTWLRPGGRVYLVADTPYMPQWNRIVPDYESAKARGEPWPGHIADFSRFMSPGARGPEFLNTLDPDIFARECAAAGFEVLRSGFFGMERLGATSNGREHAGCVARMAHG